MSRRPLLPGPRPGSSPTRPEPSATKWNSWRHQPDAPNGRCNFYTISVPGAIADQTVIISARASLPTGQILYGVEVPSNDHVIMAACNFSGGTWDALSSFPIRTVTFG